ncbi:hypothetical protein [Ferruginibacter sp.]
MKRIKLIAQIVLCTAALLAYIIAELNRGVQSADASAATMATVSDKVKTKNISANETTDYKLVLIQIGNTYSPIENLLPVCKYQLIQFKTQSGDRCFKTDNLFQQ